jgi:hypothetical protein
MSEDELEKFILKAHEMLDVLSRVRGGAHDALVGVWIKCWIELDPHHMAFNPAPIAGSRVADIMFLEPTDYDEEEPYIWGPVGAAEIENVKDKWFDKLESLREYVEKYRLRFALLCVRVYTNSKEEAKAFEQLREKVMEVSRRTPNVKWILYRLDEYSWKEDWRAVVFEPDPEAMTYFYRFIGSGEGLIIENGEVVFKSKAESRGIESM